jgi:hemerythrin
MKWKDAYLVGIPEIDKEHQFVVQCVTDIEDVAARGEHWNAAIARLLFFLESHFSAEERLMRAAEYPKLAAHIKEHEEFMAVAKSIEARTLREPPLPAMVGLLSNWLDQHFLFADRQYAEFVQRH